MIWLLSSPWFLRSGPSHGLLPTDRQVIQSSSTLLMAHAAGYFHLHLISDATGETLITVARAAAAQYVKVTPVEHVHPGLWVNEPEARQHFHAAMKNRYESVARANAAWGTEFDSFDSVDFPKDPKNPRRWLDFINWYHDALTERTGVLLDVIKKSELPCFNRGSHRCVIKPTHLGLNLSEQRLQAFEGKQVVGHL